MLVREIMTCPAFSIHQDAPIDDALRLMAERKVTALPVVDSQDRLVGVLSEIDLLRRAVSPDRRAHFMPLHEAEPLPSTVGEMMTREPRYTTEKADVAELIQLFTRSSFKSLPVVRDEKLIGVISRSDVIRALWRPDEDLVVAVRNRLHENGQDAWQVWVHNGIVELTGVRSQREADMAAAIASSVIGVRRVHVALPEA